MKFSTILTRSSIGNDDIDIFIVTIRSCVFEYKINSIREYLIINNKGILLLYLKRNEDDSIEFSFLVFFDSRGTNERKYSGFMVDDSNWPKRWLRMPCSVIQYLIEKRKTSRVSSLITRKKEKEEEEKKEKEKKYVQKFRVLFFQDNAQFLFETKE